MDRLALIEVLDHDGHVLHAIPVKRWPVTIGRALDCDVVLHDPYTAPLHATIDVASPGSRELVLRVGQTVNGVRWPGSTLVAGASAPLPAGQAWRAGRSSLRVRLAGEALPAEQPLAAPAARRTHLMTLGLTGILLLWMAGTLWLENDPGAGWNNYLPNMLSLLLGLTLWCCLWGLGSKLFQRHFSFMPHLRVVVACALAGVALDTLLALGSFALPWSWLSQIRGWAAGGVAAVLLAGHMRLILPGRHRVVGAVIAVTWAGIFVAGTALNWQHTGRMFNELYAATLAPPGLRLTTAQPSSALIEELRPLQRMLDRRVKEDDDTAGNNSGGEAD